MAKLEQGILGAFSGRVGTVVGYSWRGRACVRAYQRAVAYPNTPMQQAERDWFVSMVRFAAKARPALLLGLREAAAVRRMTEGNYFVMRNKRCFTQCDGAVGIDYSGLCLSQGPAAEVLFHAPRFEDGEVLSVGFEKNSMLRNASPDDSVYLFAYTPTLGESFLSAPARRRSKVLRTNLPQHWGGCEVHLYGFVIDREGRASRSTYIGSGRVNHREDSGCNLQTTNQMDDLENAASHAASSGNAARPADVSTGNHSPLLRTEAADPADVP